LAVNSPKDGLPHLDNRQYWYFVLQKAWHFRVKDAPAGASFLLKIKSLTIMRIKYL
jgi:hypothetical protein